MHIYNMFIDPHMDDKYLTIGILVTTGLAILTPVIAYLLHIIPLV